VGSPFAAGITANDLAHAAREHITATACGTPMTIYLVVLMAFLSQAGFGGSRVAVSLHALQLTANQFAIGVVIALYSLCPMLFAILIGRIADRLPPHRLVIAGSLIMTLALVLPVVVPGLPALCVAAFVLGFAHQVFSLPIEALVGSIGGSEKRARNYALITMAWSAANFLGPVMAGLSIDHIGQLEVYLVLAVFTFAPIVMLALKRDLLPRSGARHKEIEGRSSVLDLWRIASLRNTIIAAGVVGSAQDLFQFYMPIYGHAVELSASAIGTILGVASLAAFVIRGILPLFSQRFTEAQILKSAIFISAFAFMLFPLFTNAFALSAIAFVLGLGVGCAMPMTMSLLYALAPENRLAEAFGLHKTVRNATHLVVPIVFGSIGAAFGFATVFLANSGMLATGGLLLRKLRTGSGRG
jgi:predicted MFS family arabinose efflux permease